jgi:uncharacterized protein YceK
VGTRVTRSVALLLALVAGSGCMTIDTQTDEGYEGPRTYSGVRRDLTILPDAFLSFAIPWVGIALVDLPFSFLADTVILPVTIPREAERARKHEEEARVDVERPSVVTPAAGEAPVATAHRLYTECAKLLKEQDSHFADCYSIDATVEIIGSQPMRGADYKIELRKALKRDASDFVLIEWRDPEFSADGERVRIAVKRAISEDATRIPVALVVGPGADGGWRILEEIGPGFTRK